MDEDIDTGTHPTVIQQVTLPDGNVVKIEARLIGDEQVGVSLPSFDEVGRTITSVAQALSAALAAAKPDKASVEFSVEVAVESGTLTALIAKGNAKANLKITLSWEK